MHTGSSCNRDLYGAIPLQNVLNLMQCLSTTTYVPKLLPWSRAPYKAKGEWDKKNCLVRKRLLWPTQFWNFVSWDTFPECTTRSETLPTLFHFAQNPWREWIRYTKNPREWRQRTPAAPPFPDLQFVPQDSRKPPAINYRQSPQKLNQWSETSAPRDTRRQAGRKS